MIIDHRYEVLESLGSGAWSNVYKVNDKRTGKLYTLKLFQYLSSSDLYGKFSAEDMHHITQIEHPNLAHVVDFGHVGDHIYSLTEHYEGSSLKNFKFRKSQMEFFYDIIVQIAYALDALHEQDILHKDLKPENVLYSIDGNRVEVKVIDYGFTKIDSNKDQQTVTGSLPYLAPEAFTNQIITTASDYYSLGVMLYKITTNNFPFSVDQINALITGSQHYFIPKFPSELNEDIPQALEKFILRLLEKNPENRFHTAEEIINHINRIQTKQYPYSIEWSLVNKLKFNSYISRASYSHQILEYVQSAEKSNGKIVSLIGGEGLGKDTVLSLFRYHLLNGSYFLFDYTCSRQDHEPFFALIKEFMQSLSKEEVTKYDSLANISEKFKLYLFQSTRDAKRVTQNKEELQSDFDSVKRLLVSLSEHKPIIFIIRNAQHIHKHTIDFINYISQAVSRHKILIVLGFNEYTKISQINHSIILQISPLAYLETSQYMKKLLDTSATDAFINRVWELSAGNPYFIREILVDQVHKKAIVRNKGLSFNYEFSKYELPTKLLNSIYSRLSHVKDKHRQHLQLLSIAECPLNKDLITHVIKIKGKALYDFLNDCVFNEILYKSNQDYLFLYKAAQEKLKSETEKEVHKAVSASILDFYRKHRIFDTKTCRGIIKNAINATDYTAQREYTMRLFELYEEARNQEAAYKAILEVIEIDFSAELDLSIPELISDLMLFQEKTELTGFCNCSQKVINGIKKLPELFEKYYVLGTIYFIMEDLDRALQYLTQAEKLVVTGKQRVLLQFYYIHIYAQRDADKMKELLDALAEVELPLDLKIAYVDRLAVYYKIKNEMLTAIKTAEDFISELPSVQDYKVLLRLASLHNNLGVCYSNQKNIEEADEHFKIALSLWSRFNVKRYLGLIYNNIADLYLKQGNTPVSESYSHKGYNVAEEQGLHSTMALALLNMGEAHIKMGDFQTAVDLLTRSERIIKSLKSTKFLSSIQVNLALALSKIVSFGNYYKFIRKNEPHLLEGSIREINPLIKTYFYYLFELGLPKKIAKLLRKNVHINFHEIHEDEFYHNTLSLMAILNNDFTQAREHLKTAVKFAGEVRNHYALTVFYVFEIECCIGLGDYAGAEEMIAKAMDLSKRYQYRYWYFNLLYLRAVIDLARSHKPLRYILRELISQYNDVEKYEYFLLSAKIRLLIIKIYQAVNAESDAAQWFDSYKVFLRKITEGIDDDDRQQYLKQNHYYVESPPKLDLSNISSRFHNTKAQWTELQYSLLNIQNPDRIKFFIDKGLKEIISPWKYQIMLYSEKHNSYSLYLQNASHGEYIITPEIFQFIDKAFKTDNIITADFDNVHNMIVPLQIKYHKIGFMIISDRNELNFTRLEISMLRTIKQHITNLIMRIQDYSEITQKMHMMNRLMSITHSLMRVVEIKALESEIVSACIEFTGASRGFLIKKDEEGNYIYQIAMDFRKSPLSNISVISKTVISECQYTKAAIYTYNALEDNRFKNSISVQDYKLHAVFCAPLIINEEIYGFIYLDNFLDNSQSMYLNPEITTLLFDQISIALKNALQYESIIQKSHELQSLEALKNEFMAIVSHELNTPLTTLQGYVSRLKRSLFSDEEEKQDIINKIESNVKKLILTTNDIITMNNYNLKSDLPKVTLSIADILNLIHHEIEIVSRHRKMFIKVEASADLPEIEGNWEAVHLMIYNLVLNSIRFTNDFGTIILGARRSAFQEEKLNNRDTLVIYVQDNGIGIPEYQLKNVFRKFYELNEIYAHKSGTIEYRSSGLGLGLATSRRIAELHNGNIWIKSKENEGTTVFISLPIKQEK